MDWKVATPFSKTAKGWIMRYIPTEKHRFDFIPATYTHDRSRQNSTGRDWLDYLGQAWDTWKAACRSGKNVGFVTAFPQLPLWLGLFKRLSGSRRPLLAWCFNLGRTYDGWKGSLARFALSQVDLFVVHSRKEIETYSQWLQLPADRFLFVPLSIELAEPQFSEDTEQPYVVAMGTANRDYRRLIEAVRVLGYPTKIIAGPHAMTGLSIPDNVTVLSNLTIQQCHELSQKARINIVPVDNTETASGQVTVLEAMMYGKAVIATECAGTVDYVEHDVNGWLIPPRDTDAMKAALEALWNDDAMRQRLGDQAAQYIREHVTFEAVSHPMVRMLDQIQR
jgi:glycosyltransferase involved in cell wall biosynthesis